MSHFEKMGAKKDYLERRGPIQVSNPEAATWSAINCSGSVWKMGCSSRKSCGIRGARNCS
ncbi:unnamed protein product [Caenorhabditis brenneri]